MVIDPYNWLNLSHQKRGSHPAWVSIKLLNKWERRTLHKNTCHPQMIFHGTFRPIRKQPGSEGHPPAMFLRLMPHQDTPHNHIYVHQMAFKTHPDKKNIPQCFIPRRPCKHENRVNMHCNCSKTRLYMPAYAFQRHTHTRIIHHHQWGRNSPWGLFTHRSVMGCDKPLVTP